MANDAAVELCENGIEDRLPAVVDALETAEDIARRLNVTEKHVYAMAKRGDIPSIACGRYVRFCWADIQHRLRRNTHGNQKP